MQRRSRSLSEKRSGFSGVPLLTIEAILFVDESYICPNWLVGETHSQLFIKCPVACSLPSQIQTIQLNPPPPPPPPLQYPWPFSWVALPHFQASWPFSPVPQLFLFPPSSSFVLLFEWLHLLHHSLRLFRIVRNLGEHLFRTDCKLIEEDHRVHAHGSIEWHR